MEDNTVNLGDKKIDPKDQQNQQQQQQQFQKLHPAKIAELDGQPTYGTKKVVTDPDLKNAVPKGKRGTKQKPAPEGYQYPRHQGKKTGRKTKSQEEMEHRIRFTSHLLGQRMFKGDIKRVLKQRWNIGHQMAEIYISRARKLLAIQAGKSVEQHRADSYSFYNSVMNHPQATLRDKMWAQGMIDRLFGLPIHTVMHQGDASKPIQHEVVAVDPMNLIAKARLLRQEVEALRDKRHNDVIEGTARVIADGSGEGTGRDIREDRSGQEKEEAKNQEGVEEGQRGNTSGSPADTTPAAGTGRAGEAVI